LLIFELVLNNGWQMELHLNSTMSSALEVLSLFVIPIGGGIPAGVLLARNRAIQWPLTVLLYLISDIILACVFEPLMRIFVKVGKRSPMIAKVGEAFGKTVKKTTAHFGSRLGPLALVTVSFGVDPMTGRAAAAAAGHGFVVGWILAITGDMIYFSVIMVSTLWLNEYVGGETTTTIIILVLMAVVPVIVRRIRGVKSPQAAS
jgi:hypothetical protein